MTAKTETPRANHYRVEFKRHKETSGLIEWLLDEFEHLERENAALRERLSESQHNWQVLNLQILAELRPPTVTEQSIPERVKAMRERLERIERDENFYLIKYNAVGENDSNDTSTDVIVPGGKP